MSRAQRVLLAVVNVLVLAPVALLVAFLVRHAGETGAEIIVIVFAPFLLLLPIVVLFDVIFATRALRRGSHGARKVGAITVVVIGVGLLGLVGASIVTGIRDRSERTRLVGYDEARDLVADCNVEYINRDAHSASITLRRPDGDQWSHDTATRNYTPLARLARDVRDRCGRIESVDSRYPIVRTPIAVPDALRLIDACELNGVYYDNGPGPDDRATTRGTKDTGVLLRHAHASSPQQLMVTDPIVAATLVPAARAATVHCHELFVYNHGIVER